MNFMLFEHCLQDSSSVRWFIISIRNSTVTLWYFARGNRMSEIVTWGMICFCFYLTGLVKNKWTQYTVRCNRQNRTNGILGTSNFLSIPAFLNNWKNLKCKRNMLTCPSSYMDVLKVFLPRIYLHIREVLLILKMQIGYMYSYEWHSSW